jgi:DNA-binding response OmpR family regulator
MEERKLIYIVEDEEEIVDFVTEYLKEEDYEVEAFFRGDTALDAIKKNPPDLVVLDIMLPGINGLKLLKKLREDSYIPVILLTSRLEEVDKILGIEMGADDYITKPFSPRELVARIGSIFRRIGAVRSGLARKDILRFSNLSLDLAKREIMFQNKNIDLTSTEFDILKLMMKAPGKVFSREELLDHIWGNDFAGETRAIDVHIKNLRKKIGEVGGSPDIIRSIRSVGYKLENQIL